MTPRSRSLAVAITLKPWTAWTSSSSSGIGSVFSDRIVISASCTSDGMRVSSSTRASLPALHRPEDRAGDERVPARPLGQQPGVVPAVAQRLLGRARRALDDQRAVAGDRRREVLGHPRLGRAGDAEQEQRAVGRERGDGQLDQPPLADVLRRDRRAVGLAAEQVRGHRPRRQPPPRRARPVVDPLERRQLLGVELLGVGPQEWRLGGHDSSRSMAARALRMSHSRRRSRPPRSLRRSSASPANAGSSRYPANSTSGPRSPAVRR